MTAMNTTIERLADDKLRLDVEVPATMVQEAVDHTLVMMGREMRLPGFRPGKVPAQAVLARVGREAAVAEAVRYFIDDWYRSAVLASGIRPVSQPELDLADTPTEGSPLKFSATVEVAPKPRLPKLDTLEVDKPNLPDTQKYVDQVLETTLRGAGTLVETSEPAAQGDEVLVDFHCTVDDKPVRGAAASGYEARLGEGRLLQELEEAIVGTPAGTELQVVVDFPPDHPMDELAGQKATFHLNVREVQRVELPELTDDVARQVSEFDTADALVDDIRSSITARLENEVQGIFRANAVAALAGAAELSEPQALVERRQQELFVQLKQQLEEAGMNVETYVESTGQDMSALFGELEQQARDDLRRELCLLALAEDAGLEVTEEDLRAEVQEHANHTGADVEETMERLMTTGRADMLRGELLMQRAIDHLVARAKPVPVDLPVAPSESDAASEAAPAQE